MMQIRFRRTGRTRARDHRAATTHVARPRPASPPARSRQQGPRGKVEPFTDVRQIQQSLKAAGLKLMAEADVTTKGPASFIVLDPDGNPVLVDQHV